jgi:hypothetical protein
LGRDGWRRARADCPWWLGSAGEEWRWGSGGAAKGTGKEVEGAPSVGAELGAVRRSSEEDRGSSKMVARWHSGSNGQRRKRVAPGEGRSFQRSHEAVAEGGGNGGWDGGRERPVKPWADKAVATVRTWSARRHCCSDCVADGWAHAVLYFPELCKLAQHMEFENGCLTMFQKFPIFHVARLGHYEQFSQLRRQPILNRI